MPSERRVYPRIAVDGEANIVISGAIRNATLLNLSQSGIELECKHQLVERMSQYRKDSGLYPDIDLEFSLPVSNQSQRKVKSSCIVSHLRRLSQDTYHLGLSFISLTELDEKRVSDFIRHTSEHPQ
jgi:c-di-GMP-binding flagellar brake protein YcgR